MYKKIGIIGSGFSSLAASCYLAKVGFEVLILEKNEQVGGRASQFKKDGFTFDMGPTFYWMPDVFERFFNDFGKKVSDYYQLDKLSPAYRVYFDKDDFIQVGDSLDKIADAFEKIEKGSGLKLKKLIAKAGENYDLAIGDLVYQPGLRLTEIITFKTMTKLGLFVQHISGMAKRYFKDSRLRQLIEFPVLFLGAKPSDTPAFYNFMNYADFGLGTWHPKGGMYRVVLAMQSLAKSLGVVIKTDDAVRGFEFKGTQITAVKSEKATYPVDGVLSGADYVHTESLLPKSLRVYSDAYWQRKTFAPSALLFYVGFGRKIPKVNHHTLFFDADFEEHARCIYDDRCHPETPLFYASFPSKTDKSVAPSGKEAAIFLIPLAPAVADTDAIRADYFDKIMQRLQHVSGIPVQEHILFKASFGVKDFISRYHSYKGNAYGLANTLLQTHYLRPKIKSRKIGNLYFTGQLTVPGPGVPPSLISGKLVSDLIIKESL